MKANLIGITGAARTGKDTIAKHLSTQYGAHVYAFAYPIKAGVRAMFNLDMRHTDGLLKETPIDHLGGKSPRQLMQMLGTEFGRDMVSKSVWRDMAAETWKRCQEKGQSLVITDVRFENEADLIRELGGTVLHVKRDDAEPVARHCSESGVPAREGDVTVTNNDTIKALLHTVDALHVAGLMGVAA
jgi:hypothetical protein